MDLRQHQDLSSQRILILMRGLPGTGKSHAARRLAGPDGLVLETNEYFYRRPGDLSQGGLTVPSHSLRKRPQ